MPSPIRGATYSFLHGVSKLYDFGSLAIENLFREQKMRIALGSSVKAVSDGSDFTHLEAERLTMLEGKRIILATLTAMEEDKTTV